MIMRKGEARTQAISPVRRSDPNARPVNFKSEILFERICSSLEGREQIREIYSYLPVPVRETDCGLLLAPSLTSMVAVRAPRAEGVNFTLMVQCALGLRLRPQVFVCVKSPGSAPVKVTPEKVNVVVRLLVRVTFLATLVVPTFWAAKVSEAGEAVA